MTLALALYQPDIAQNAGTLARAAACLDVTLHIIEPAGFPVGDAGFRRAGMDYLDRAAITRHDSFTAFENWRAVERRRLILCTTRGAVAYTAFAFAPDDVLLLGRESAGVPEEVHAAADARIAIPLMEGARSLNVALAGAMILGEALRQTGGFPPYHPHPQA
ncbi:tRNA (cytidine/uridine-2'-O-)-methyltransferase [Ancylobacter aquaticus]|uniref:tRNA (cytidine(34)-2'-O)-methyltransferase n=1 Tax=Ancylobacter aquaticus TaxID=100 RepID=A0A4R1I4I5_ANCAQ|nr:tRNA (cytidine(34)-2'-O)-methyltransferase [Ancylobacter aquaticus]TCK28941.1 tRNA (cytidine/uridine-2'-O-)-methyltransferase [Ancylobacter aquaticus]